MVLPLFSWLAASGDDAESSTRSPSRESRQSAVAAINIRASQTDEDIASIAAVRAGDKSAFSALYHTYYAPMWRLAARLTGSDDAAADVTHDIFLAIWRQRSTWAPTTSIREYLLRAARNRSLHIVEHATIIARNTSAIQAVVEETHHHMLSDTVVAQHDIECAVSDALATLPERQRSAFLLRWDSDLSNAAIGRVLGISDVAAGKLLNKAQRTLQNVLGKFR